MTRPLPVTQSAPRAARVCLEVRADAIEVAGLRRRVCALAADMGMDQQRQAEVALAVGEACANVVVHAYVGFSEPGTIRLTADAGPDGLIVEVSDQGLGMRPRRDSPGLGFGLPLIAATATSVETSQRPRGGSRLRMLFAFSAADTDRSRLRSV